MCTLDIVKTMKLKKANRGFESDYFKTRDAVSRIEFI